VNLRRAPAKFEFARQVVQAATAPLMLVDQELRVLAASQGYLRAFGEAADPQGRRLDEITGGAWREPRVWDLVERVLRGEPPGAVDAEVVCPEGVRRVRVGVTPTEPRARGGAPLVVAIEDLTETAAREAAHLAQLRETEALLHEAQHRTANNLAIISTILGLKARRVASEETRSELEGARRRVMAMATIERHLQLVEPHKPTAVRPYLQALARQLSDSLIGDGRAIEIAVEAKAGSQPRRIAVILGLVVTELVINAIKYAFPRGRGGRIVVEYWETPQGWCAAVSDDGAGMRRGGEPGSRLGTGIVAALAQQLHADAKISSSPAGTRVELCCEHETG
jgi:two-component sensor histidine kinase